MYQWLLRPKHLNNYWRLLIFYGYKGKDLQKVRSRVGCLIEAPGLYGNMTAYENLNIKCKLFGIKKAGYIEEILKTVGLEHVGRKKTKHFSLGMKQRCPNWHGHRHLRNIESPHPYT